MKVHNMKLQMKLQTKLTICVIVLVIFTTGAAGVVSSIAQYKALNSNVEKNLTTMVTLASKQIDGDDLEKIKNSKSEDSKGYLKIQNSLRLILESANQLSIDEISRLLSTYDKLELSKAKQNLNMVYAYTMYANEGKLFYGVDAYPSSDSKNHSTAGAKVVIEDQGKRDITEKVDKVLSGKGPLITGLYKDEFGTWRTGLAAVKDSNGNIIGVVGVDASIEFINKEGTKLITSLILNTVILLLAVILIAVLISREITKPILELKKRVKEIGDGNFDLDININTGDEIQDLADSFTTMTQKLKVYMKDLSETTAAKERMDSELKVANSIQCSMLPRLFPPFPQRKDLSIYASMTPAKEVGGDFYDFFFIGEDKLAFVMADVSGKGIPAALFMMITKTIIKNNALAGYDVNEILVRSNNSLCENNDENMFVTVFLGILDVKTGLLNYANAGHNPPLICKAGNKFDWLPVKRGLVLAGMENTRYISQEIQLSKGDRIFCYTDGVTEAMNETKELYSDSRLLATLNKVKDTSEVETLLTAVKEDVDVFANGEEQADDITILVLELK